MHNGCHDLPLKLTWASSSPKGNGEERSIFVLLTPLKTIISKASFKYPPYSYLARILAWHYDRYKTTTEGFFLGGGVSSYHNSPPL